MTDLAHPDAAYEVRCYHPDARPDLAPGHGAIAMRTRRPARFRARRPLDTPTVVVDGKPAMSGWGTALIVVPAGDRRVEVRQASTPDGVTVTVEAGDVVEVDYTPGAAGLARGRLGRAPLRSAGARLALAVLASLAFASFAAAVIFFVMGALEGVGFFATFAVIAALVAVGFGWATRT